MKKKYTEEPLIEETLTNDPVNDEPVKLEDMDGIGPVRLKKLYANGIFSIEDLIIHGEESLARMLEISWDDARKMIQTANESLNADGMFAKILISGRDYYNYRKDTIEYSTTGLDEFDEITGGFETGVITEFFGAFGSGKTQFMMVEAIMAQMPKNPCCLDCGKDHTPEIKVKPENYRVWLDKSIVKKCECGSERIWSGGGLSKFGEPCRVCYIDTENSYRGERVFQIVLNRDLVKTKPQTKTEEKQQASKEALNEEEHEKAMQFVYNIDISRPRTSAMQMMVGSNLTAMIDGDFCNVCHLRVINNQGLPTHQNHPKAKKEMSLISHDFVQDKPARLVILDSLTGRFRKEYEGRGTLSDRQMKLKTHVKIIEGAIEEKNVVCLVSNQVSEKMDIMGGGDNIRPVGGNEIGHIFTHRIYLKKPQSMTKDKITAILVDSPNHAKNEIILELGSKGIQKTSE